VSGINPLGGTHDTIFIAVFVLGGSIIGSDTTGCASGLRRFVQQFER